MAVQRRKCLNFPDVFCYICGGCTEAKQRSRITDFVERAYLAYLGVKLGDKGKGWASHIVCTSCVGDLRSWRNDKRSMGFRIPMVWREPQYHVNDCYSFCLVRPQ